MPTAEQASTAIVLCDLSQIYIPAMTIIYIMHKNSRRDIIFLWYLCDTQIIPCLTPCGTGRRVQRIDNAATKGHMMDFPSTKIFNLPS